MKKSEENHLECLKKRREAGIDVFRIHVFRVLDDIEGMQSTEEGALPEHEEYDCFDGEELQEGFVFLNLIGDGEVELD